MKALENTLITTFNRKTVKPTEKFDYSSSISPPPAALQGFKGGCDRKIPFSLPYPLSIAQAIAPPFLVPAFVNTKGHNRKS